MSGMSAGNGQNHKMNVSTKLIRDLENINVSDGFVYYWSLINYIKPTQQGHLSQKSLLQIDCKKPRRFKIVSDSFYKMPMGIGKTDMFATSHDLLAAGFSWNFSPPNSAIDGEIENVCNLVTK